jgi:hypothetical protein
MNEFLVGLAVLLAIAGNIPYIVKIFKKEVKPHPYTWLVWTIVSCVTFFGALAKGGGLGTIPILASEIFTLIIFLFSLQYGFKEIRKVDSIFLAICLLGLIPWWYTKDPTISVVVVVIIDLIAFIPTIRKTWRKPNTETPILYSSNVLRHILILFTLATINIATSFHSFAMIIVNTLMVLTILKKRLLRK